MEKGYLEFYMELNEYIVINSMRATHRVILLI